MYLLKLILAAPAGYEELALKKVGYVPLYTFYKLIVRYTATWLKLKSPWIAHQPD